MRIVSFYVSSLNFASLSLFYVHLLLSLKSIFVCDYIWLCVSLHFLFVCLCLCLFSTLLTHILFLVQIFSLPIKCALVWRRWWWCIRPCYDSMRLEFNSRKAKFWSQPFLPSLSLSHSHSLTRSFFLVTNLYSQLKKCIHNFLSFLIPDISFWATKLLTKYS